MSFTLSRAVWDHDGIRAIRKFVLSCLADRADEHGRCWPSIEDISKRCGISERCTREHLAALVEAGYLRQKRRFMQSSIYQINADKLGAPRRTAKQAAPQAHQAEHDTEHQAHATAWTAPAKSAETTGRTCQDYRQNLPERIYQGTYQEEHRDAPEATAAPAATLMCADIGNEHREPCEPDPLGNANPADLEAFAKVRTDAGKPGKPTPKEAAALTSEARAAGITPAQLVSYCAALRLPGFKARYFNPRHMERIEAEHERATAASRPAAPPPILAAQEGRTNEGTRTGRAMAAAMLQKLRGAPRKAESRPESLSRQPAPSAPGIFDHVAQAFGLTAAPAW